MIIPPAPPGQRRKPDPRQLQDAAANAGLVLPDAAMLAFQQGRMIEAIKLIRAANPGLDLARAKAAMERMQAQAHSAAGEAGKGPAGTGKRDAVAIAADADGGDGRQARPVALAAAGGRTGRGGNLDLLRRRILSRRATRGRGIG
ncbi:MAG: hypothetical protein IPF45_06555 [Thermomonas sp.]|nr:hypothetical protein [Thermomonas sp.]